MKAQLRVDGREAALDTLIRYAMDAPQVITVEGVPVAVVLRYSHHVEMRPEAKKPKSLYTYLRSIPDFDIPSRDQTLNRQQWHE